MKSTILSLTMLVCAAGVAVAQRQTRDQYVEKYKDYAVREMQRSGVPASITLAQGILESDCGNSMLAVDGNNHFGIKCHSEWTGPTLHKDDDRANECFRKYSSAYDSFVDHTNFLTQKKRYASLFELDRTDYRSWAKGLKAAGYATDPNYPTRLIDIIEALGLSIYDQDAYMTSTAGAEPAAPAEAATPALPADEAPAATPRTPRRRQSGFVIDPFHQHEVDWNNGVQYVALQDGDTFEAIAIEFHLTVSELLAINDLTPDADIVALQYVYVRTKRNRAHPDCPTHTAGRGESLWDIAHTYGVKLRKLRKYNSMPEGTEPQPGDVVSLRARKRP